MSNNENQYKTMIDRLLSLTLGRNLEWSDTADPDVFRVRLGSGFVAVQHVSGFNDEAGEFYSYYVINLYNDKGKEIDTFTPRVSGDPAASTLRELHEAARRSAHKIDDVLDGMLRELGKYPNG